MIEVFYKGSLVQMSGITVGQRKDGSRCILWENNSLEWFTSAEFDALMGA